MDTVSRIGDQSMTKVGPAFRDTLQIARLGHGHQQRDNLMRYAALMIKVISSKMEKIEGRKKGREEREKYIWRKDYF